MSRGYYKTCGRKVAPPPPTQSIQFNRVFCENSNKPSAAKSTGTLGKWGVASFTSIRSSTFALGSRKTDGTGSKRSRYESKSDNYTFNPVPNPSLSPISPKPKKFFKSRNGDEKPSASYSSVTHKKGSAKSKSEVIPPVKIKLDKEAESYKAPEEKSPVDPASNASHNPPIVLRIFKGTAQLITDDGYGAPKKEKESRKETVNSEETVEPRKLRHRMRDLVTLRNALADEDDVEDEEEEEEQEEDAEVEEEDVETVMTTVSEPQPSPPKEVESAVKEEKITMNEDFETDENDELLQEGNKLIEASLEEQDRVNQILDLSSTSESKSLESNVIEMEEPSDVPLDLHVPHPSEQEQLIKQQDCPVSFSEEANTNKEESNSDSENSEIMDRQSVVHSIKSESEIAKPRPAKKGSIFKSRSGEKRNAHYIHKWCDKDDAKQNPPAIPELTVVEGEFTDSLTRVTNYTKPDEFSEEPETFTSVTCNKNVKDFYTVVRNVKKAHQIQESGEFQEFNDDVEYILDALQDNNPIGTRCLSAITLASKCMTPAFRMHVRAHGTVAKFFKALHDASKDQSLGMCTATVMFVLSQDRLNMDLDRESLELMLSLLESDASSQALDECGFSDAQLAKTKDRVSSLCHEIKEQGHANHLNLDNITVGQLAMETLLSLTSKRAGEWFKEELRDLGGLEHIVKSIIDTASCIEEGPSIVWSTPLLDRMRRLDRCLRVLENVTLNNEDNSKYLLVYKDGIFVDTVLRVFMTCSSQLLLYPVTDGKDKTSVGAVLKDTLVSTLKILINITHDFNNQSCGSAMAGKKTGLIETSLHVLLIVPEFVPEDQKFDLVFMSLMLLINLVEHCEDNRKLLIEANAPPHPDVLFEEKRTALSALMTLFLHQEELARNVERKTDAILDGENKPPAQTKSHEEFIEETVALLLQKAGKHMEYTLVAAYIATLFGYLTLNNSEFESIIRSYLPNQNYAVMLSVLQKFYDFMTLTAASGSASSRGIKATQMLIKHLSQMDSHLNSNEPLVEPKSENPELFY